MDFTFKLGFMKLQWSFKLIMPLHWHINSIKYVRKIEMHNCALWQNKFIVWGATLSRNVSSTVGTEMPARQKATWRLVHLITFGTAKRGQWRVSGEAIFTVKKGKGSPYTITERMPYGSGGNPGSWQSASRWHERVINMAVGCHYFPPGLQLPPQPLRGLLPILLLGEQRHNGCEQFA